MLVALQLSTNKSNQNFMNLPNILRDLRKEKNWKQEYVARKIFVCRSTYAQYELGYRKKPLADDVLGRIADLYQITITELKKTA